VKKTEKTEGIKWSQELESAEKVRIRIAHDKNDPGFDPVVVGHNGNWYEIKRGEFVDVPVPIFEILDNANYL